MRRFSFSRLCSALGLLAGLFANPAASGVENRFPRPDFVSGYQSPELALPSVAPGEMNGLGNVVVLTVFLVVAALLVLRWRSRIGIVLMTIGAVLYFGFWRNGCVCPVGAVQNVTAALLVPGYSISLSVVLIFLIPIVAALFFGRVFCSGVCPLGALQELAVIRAMHLPRWLNKILSLLRYWVLGLAVFCVATGIGFVVCRADPFVGFFRLGGPLALILAGVALLAMGTVIGRPYCRFVCPYGVILEWASRVSWKRPTITPGECINCRLCESACPYDAIEVPEKPERVSAGRPSVERRVLLVLLLAVPILIACGWFGGGSLGVFLGRGHPKMMLAAAALGEESSSELMTRDRLEAFAATGESREGLEQARQTLYRRFVTGGRFLGAYFGLVLGLHLVGLSRRPSHADYRPDPAACVSCGRCYRYCPVPRPSR